MNDRTIIVDGVEYRIGDRLPLTKPKLVVRPKSWIDDPARGGRGLFTNGRGKA